MLTLLFHLNISIASHPMLRFLCLYLILSHFVLFRTLTHRPSLFPSRGLLFPLASPTFLPPLSTFFFLLKEHIFSF